MRASLLLFILAISSFAATGEDAAFRQTMNQYFMADALKPGSPAPDFQLEKVGGGMAKASELRAQKPLLVMTGSYSCPWFRDSTAQRVALIREFSDKVNFVVVYTREAHDGEGRSPYSQEPYIPAENTRDRISVKNASTYKERLAAAQHCHESLNMLSPVVVDKMDNAIWIAYGRAPNCGYLIATDGNIVCQQGLFDAREMKLAIEKLLGGSPPVKPGK